MSKIFYHQPNKITITLDKGTLGTSYFKLQPIPARATEYQKLYRKIFSASEEFDTSWPVNAVVYSRGHVFYLPPAMLYSMRSIMIIRRKLCIQENSQMF